MPLATQQNPMPTGLGASALDMSSLYVPVLQHPVLKARQGKGPG